MTRLLLAGTTIGLVALSTVIAGLLLVIDDLQRAAATDDPPWTINLGPYRGDA